jgi:hypothetical protein
MLEIPSGEIYFVFDFIFHNSYTVDAYTLTSIRRCVSLIGIKYCTAGTKGTLASVQSVGVGFESHMDFRSPQRLKRVRNRTALIHCVFGGTDSYGV